MQLGYLRHLNLREVVIFKNSFWVFNFSDFNCYWHLLMLFLWLLVDRRNQSTGHVHTTATPVHVPGSTGRYGSFSAKRCNDRYATGAPSSRPASCFCSFITGDIHLIKLVLIMMKTQVPIVGPRACGLHMKSTNTWLVLQFEASLISVAVL